MPKDREYKRHPIAAHWPETTGAEFDAFVLRMKESGYNPLYPIVTHEDMILDGWNRYRVAKAAGVKPMIGTWQGEGGTPQNFVLQANRDRNHFSAAQLAMAAVKTLETLPPESAGQTLREQADAAGVSRRTLANARKVAKKGVPELVAVVESGVARINEAAEVADLPAPVQRKAAAKVKAGKADSLFDAIDDEGLGKTKTGAPSDRKKKSKKDASEGKGDAWEGGSEVDKVEEEPARDSAGELIPKNLLDTFADIQLQDAVAMVAKIKKIIQRAAGDGNPYLRKEDGYAQCRSLIDVLQDAIPHIVCAKCRGKGGKCTQCKGAGWLSAWRKEELDKTPA